MPSDDEASILRRALAEVAARGSRKSREEGPGRRIITNAAVPENLVDCVLKLDVAMDAIEPAGFADEVASIEMVIDFIEKLMGVAADGSELDRRLRPA